ncbi:MAG: diguanylate cyclase [Proteobacteria bacterium]|nr:diguanylate cyclase [Pseudomonadota bacterium]
MTISVVSPAPALDGAALRGALLDSRQRWRDLVSLAADLAFETDEWGHIVFMMPEEVLGWPAAALIGKSADVLLPQDALPRDELTRGGAPHGFDPFRAAYPVRGRRAWLKRADGGLACMSFACAPLLDASGMQIGTRGVGFDDTDDDARRADLAAAFRRSEVINEIVAGLRREVLGQDMIRSTLDALLGALGAEGACIADASPGMPAGTVLHHAGRGAEDAASAIGAALREAAAAGADPAAAILERVLPDGRTLLAAGFLSPYGDSAVLGTWRAPGARPWDAEDRQVLAAIAGVTGVLLSHASLQQAMAAQANSDPLTGLLNRRGFLAELPRRIDRLMRDGEPGSLMFLDLDNFKALNDRFGHDAGDRTLVRVAEALTAALRPTDLVARLGGDEFALWMGGADHMTAAERAEALCLALPAEVEAMLGPIEPSFGLSIGIASWMPRGADSVDDLIHRADTAMYEVKRAGRGHWRVAHPAEADGGAARGGAA